MCLLLYLVVLVLLGCCWWVGDLEVRTKIILTVIYVLSWGLVFLPGDYAIVFPIVQGIFGLTVGAMTFGKSMSGG